MRPRPSKFRLSEREAEKLAEGRLGMKASKKDINTNLEGYVLAIESYMKALEEYFDSINEKDIKNKHTIIDDVKIFKEKYGGKYDEFSKTEQK